jgi:anti-anti-sigma factor
MLLSQPPGRCVRSARSRFTISLLPGATFWPARTHRKGPLMTCGDFKHLRLKTVDDVLLVEVTSRTVQGPDRSQEFCNELTSVVDLDGGLPLVVDLRRTCYFSSMGLSALFKLVKLAKERQRPIRFCHIHPDVRALADIAGLPLVVEIHDTSESAIEAFRVPQA